MPIYAYRCESCGFAKDALQKISDAPLTVCPECGRDTFKKQLTAAGFQLKGSGWYATDFRGGASAPAGGQVAPATANASGNNSDTAPGGDSTASASGGTTTGGCGSSCACH